MGFHLKTSSRAIFRDQKSLSRVNAGAHKSEEHIIIIRMIIMVMIIMIMIRMMMIIIILLIMRINASSKKS